jgi:hypothetical protein
MSERRKKWIMGGLVIVAMITFVLMYTGGRGDIVNDFLHYFGVGPGAAKVTTLYNTSVTTKELQQLTQRRLLAQQAFEAAFDVAGSKIQEEKRLLDQEQTNRGPDAKPGLDYYQAQEKLKDAERQLARLKIGILSQFLGAQTTEELLNFKVWLHQADNLKIELTAADTDAQIKHITDDRAKLDDVYARVSRNASVKASPDGVEQAVADEFRVLMAKQALLNYSPESRYDEMPFEQRIRLLQQLNLPPLEYFNLPPAPGGDRQVPAPVTPYEFWKYYQDQRTSLDVSLLALAVPQPPAGGTSADHSDLEQKELKALFNRYRNQEARPDQREPGFKVPRKIALAWAGTDPSAPHYRDAAARLGDAWRAVQAVGMGANLTQTGVPFLVDPYFLAEYSRMRDAGRFSLAPVTQSDFALSIYASRVGPADAAAVLAKTANAAGGLTSPLGALALYQAGTAQRNAKDLEPLVAQEAKQRVPFGVTLVLSGSGSSAQAALPATLTALGLAAHGNETKLYLPLDAVRSQALAAVQQAFAREAVIGNLRAFQKEMDNRRSKPGEVQKWLPKGLEEFHLDQHAMGEPQSLYDIATAPALQPLKDAFLPQQFLTPGPKADEQFAQALFQGEGTYQPQPWPPSQFAGDDPWRKAEQPLLVWRTEDQKAFVPTFEEVKDKVEAAWRLQQARRATDELAHKIREEAGKTGGDLPQLVQLAADHKLELINLTQVAREVPETVAVPSGHRYARYQFPATIRYPVEDKDHPDKDWLGQLLKLQNPGDTVILEDQPGRTFYVAVLRSRIDPKVDTFAAVYKDAAVALNRDQLMDTLLRQQRDQYRKDFEKELRIEAGADEQGNYKLDPDYVKSHEKRGGSDEGP